MHSYTKCNVTAIALTVSIAVVFTCTYVSGQSAPPPVQSGGITVSGPPVASGSAGGMPGGAGGMPGAIPSMAGNTKITNPAIYIKDGSYLPKESYASAAAGGTVGDSSASGVKIKSEAENFNGIYVTGGKSQYTLSDSVIELSGNGSNDFSGIGSGAMTDAGTLILKNVRIETSGTIRPATTATGTGILKVYDSTLITHGGTLPDGYVSKVGAGMMEAPVMLLITGTCRSTLVMGSGRSYFYNTKVVADGWGALSTDSGRDAYLETNNCDILVNNSGYGTYADNSCTVVLNDTRLRSATYTGIISGNGKIYLNNITEKGAVNCVMIHAPGTDFTRIATLEIKGGKISTKEEPILVKSANADIVLDGVWFLPGNGILIKSVIDNNKRSALLRWLLDSDKKTTPVTGPVTGIRTTLKNMSLKGNIVHEDTARKMSLVLEGTTLKGSITGSVWTITDVSVSLDKDSKWTATADSKVTIAGNADIKSFDAPRGVTITVRAGEGCTLKGTYKLSSGGNLTVKAN